MPQGASLARFVLRAPGRRRTPAKGAGERGSSGTSPTALMASTPRLTARSNVFRPGPPDPHERGLCLRFYATPDADIKVRKASIAPRNLLSQMGIRKRKEGTPGDGPRRCQLSCGTGLEGEPRRSRSVTARVSPTLFITRKLQGPRLRAPLVVAGDAVDAAPAFFPGRFRGPYRARFTTTPGHPSGPRRTGRH